MISADDEFMIGAVYLGDGAYAKVDNERDAMLVFTTNGLTVTNRVYLGIDELTALIHFAAKKFFPDGNDA